jgi:two-component system CheB/CheR fusion protein
MTQQTTIVVGIGASAGGIEALKGFFSQVQDNSDMAFVVVTHLSPTRESHLHEVISHFTTLPVEVIKDGDLARAGVVHVMPEQVFLSISDGRLRLLPIDPAKSQRKPIDYFFQALARDQEERAVGIVLSGSGDDGTLGVQAINAHGGVTFAQVTNGTGLDYPSMPDSALASGAVNFALSVEQMPEKLRNLHKAATALGSGLLRGELSTPELAQRRLRDEISKFLQDYSGQDFAGYKSKTFFRRVARRMQVVNCLTHNAYLKRLGEDPSEVMALFHDLLISVTDFFRDESAFETLGAQIMPLLTADRDARDTIRIWVPGCATGQEAYSLAILVQENMAAGSAHPKVRIFATDIDEPALAIARSARYPDIGLENVSKKRKDRFFRRDGSSCQRQSKSEPKGRAKCCHFWVGMIAA